MITRLDVQYDDNTVFSDFTLDQESFIADSSSFTYEVSNDKLYIGFFKPINAFYVELGTANTNSATLSLKYYNGTSFTAVAGDIDRTKGFTRSGFVEWDRNQADEAKTTISGAAITTEQFWYEITFDATLTAVTMNGLSILFSDDNDLKEDEPLVTDFLPSGETTFVKFHQAARNKIMADMQNRGIRTRAQSDFGPNIVLAPGSNSDYRQLTPYDFLEREELRQASKYLVLSKVYFFQSDNPEDTYRANADKYKEDYNMAMKKFYLSIDLDQDGKADSFEKVRSMGGRISRV